MSVRGSVLTVAGFVLLGVGGLGIVLPVLPTTPFVIAAAACFSRSSPRFERWLVSHPRFGTAIRAWRSRRAIPTGAKIAAIMSMMAGFTALVATGQAPPLLLVAVGTILVACAAYILSRPAR